MRLACRCWLRADMQAVKFSKRVQRSCCDPSSFPTKAEVFKVTSSCSSLSCRARMTMSSTFYFQIHGLSKQKALLDVGLARKGRYLSGISQELLHVQVATLTHCIPLH
jgi:hypothetical protein